MTTPIDQSNSAGDVAIFGLPDELIMNIFTYITRISRKMELEQVSRRFRFVSSQSPSWRGIHKLEIMMGCRDWECRGIKLKGKCGRFCHLNNHSINIEKWPAAIQLLIDRTQIQQLVVHGGGGYDIRNILDDNRTLLPDLMEKFKKNGDKMKIELIEFHYNPWNGKGPSQLVKSFLCDSIQISIPSLKELTSIIRNEVKKNSMCEMWSIVKECQNLHSITCEGYIVNVDALVGKPLTKMTFVGGPGVIGMDGVARAINGTMGQGVSNLTLIESDTLYINLRGLCDGLNEKSREKLKIITIIILSSGRFNDIIRLFPFIPSMFPNLQKLHIHLDEDDYDTNENGLRFLHNEVKLCHQTIISSIYVTSTGDWKLGGFEKAVEFHSPKPDTTSLSHLIWEIFNGFDADWESNSRKNPGRMPKNLQKIYAKLLSPRCTIDEIFENCKGQGGYFRNKFVETLLFLEEFQLKESREKSAFFAHLKDNLDMFPEDIAKYKILPKLIEAYEFGDAGSNVLSPLFRIGKLLDDNEYQEKIVPCIVKLFGSPDRATRVKLLEKIEEFVVHLNTTVVNEKIYGNLATGFMDTNPAVRESTVKAMIHLAPKLNYQNLNVELMKHLARLQGKDDQPGIRTNTTICLGKIGSYINPQHRPKILISACSRSMKDPFPPARVAGILALSATQQYYQLTDIANRILPCICPLTVDPEKQVRDQAFKAVNGFLEKLQKASENPDCIPELEAQVQAGSGGGVLSAEKVPQWASWALGAISGKFYKSTPTKTIEENKDSVPEEKSTSRSVTPPIREEKEESPEKWTNEDEADGWGELDDSWDEVKEKEKEKKGNEAWDEDDEEDWKGWDDNDEKPISPPKPMVSTTSGRTGMKLGSQKVTPVDDDSFLTELLGEPAPIIDFSVKKTTPKPLTNQGLSSSTVIGPTGPVKTRLDKKKTTNDDWGGWDVEEETTATSGGGWGEDDWGDGHFDNYTKTNEREKRRQEAAERSKQRKEEMAKRKQQKQAGSMKLGTKKLT